MYAFGFEGPMTYEPDGIRTIPCGLLGKNFEALTPTRSPLSSFEQENSKNKNATNNKFFFILYMYTISKIGP